MSLDEDTVKLRQSIIRTNSISYNFSVILKHQEYFGLAEIAFYIQSLAFDQLPIDFSGAEVDTLIVNSLQVPAVRTENFLIINKALLQKGRNRISILYSCTYDNDKSGCINFKDDGKDYIYTDFEPYSANRVFPCFDQPNLKAPMTLSVITPSDWNVFSNESALISQKFTPESYIDKVKWQHEPSKHLLNTHILRANQDSKTTFFPPTEILPTYLYCFAAGDYASVVYEEPTWDGPSLSLHCVPTSLQYLKNISSFIFDLTTKSVKFYEKFFGHLYPFKKYDQIWIRQCGFTAMENAGIVTYNEARTLPRGQSTQTELYYLANTITHQLSHHWFGNFVTMNWWDDVWLNESFADFISHFCIEKILDQLEYKFESSLAFFVDRKAWGYDEDQCNLYTHPIRGTVQNTGVANSIFDGITYAKGASTMKQLLYLVGQDNFSKALASYFDRFAWSNATIYELLKDLQPYFPSGQININDWSDRWLLKPSLNVFETIRDPTSTAADSILLIKQTPFTNSYPYLRHHKIKIAFFGVDAKLTEVKEVLIAPQETTQIKFDASKGVSAVLLNYSDESFLENIIDPASLAFFMDKIELITDFYTRTQIWYNIAALVKLAVLPISDFVDFLTAKLFTEPSNLIFEKMLETVLYAIQNYLPKGERDPYITILCDKIVTNLRIVPDGERQLIMQKYYVEFSINEVQVKRLVEWLRGEDKSLVDKPMNNSFKWKTVIKAFALKTWSNKQKLKLFDEVKAVDGSSAADDAKIVCDAILANDLEFQVIYESFKNQELSATIKSLQASGWRNEYHSAKLLAYRDRYFQDIIEVSDSLKYEGFYLFYSQLSPFDDDLAYQIKKYKDVVTTLKELGNFKEHVANINKIIDILTLREENYAFHADLNSTLTQTRSINRHSVIRPGSIKYNVHLAFNRDDFSGVAQITFELYKVPKILPIDFKYKEVHSLIINDRLVNADAIRNGVFLQIPRVYLKVGVNSIGVHYTNDYDNDGIGVFRFVDSSDLTERIYTYTSFEPHGAHRLFACFDQPNLKAPVSFNIIVPQGWVSVANTLQSQSKVAFTPAAYSLATQTSYAVLRDNFTKTIVQPSEFSVYVVTEPLSTYLYCVAAGEYESISLPVEDRYNNIPMTLYCFKSYLADLQKISDFYFEFTIQTLKFYEQKFDVPYPFKKYDYIFYEQSWAMQNPGIVTFPNGYIFQKQVADDRKMRVAYVIAHECAHQWFGNLVTMDWWDDLWLNESFADAIGYYCTEGIKDRVSTFTYNTVLITMLGSTVSGYRQDQRSIITHPIRSVVSNAEVANSIFDNITYEKGAATLYQLMFLMGETNFFSGLQNYFKDYAWKNGTIDTFLAYLERQFILEEFTLDQWKKDWLLTPSLNVLTPVWDPKDEAPDAKLRIIQTAFTPIYPTLRFHKVRIYFFNENGTYDKFQHLIGKENETIITYSGNKQYQAILINAEGEDFVKVSFDAQSLKFFSANLNKIQNVLSRMVIWHYMNESVRDASLKVTSFVDTVLTLIFEETEDSIFNFQFNFLHLCTSSFLPIPQRPAVRAKVYDKLLQRLQLNVPQIKDTLNRLTIIKDWLPIFATSDDQIDFLEQWRSGTALPDFPITLSQAWNVVKLYYTSKTASAEKKAAVLANQTLKNPGVKAQTVANTCDALSANQARFKEIYQIFKSNATSVQSKKAFAAGWNHPIHLTWLQVYKEDYFTDIQFLQQSLESNQFTFFYTYLQPIDDNLADSIKSYSQLNIPGSDMEGHRVQLKQIADEYQVRLALYNFNK